MQNKIPELFFHLYIYVAGRNTMKQIKYNIRTKNLNDLISQTK